MINIELIKNLREETGAGMLEVKEALEKFDGDVDKAREALMKKGAERAAKKQAERETKDGLIESYIHGAGKVGSLVHIACETDFVAKTDQFKWLAHEIAMQVAAMDYENIEQVLSDDYLKDPSKKVSDLVTETIAKVGEKIELVNFCKLTIRD